MAKCWCFKPEPLSCLDCDMKRYPLTEEEVGDCLSALVFFRGNYMDRKGSVETRAAMKRLEGKLWKMLRAK